MNAKLKILLIGIGACAASIGLMWILDYYLLVNLGEFTMKISQKYLAFNLTSIDRILVRWLPLIIAIASVSINLLSIKLYLKTTLWTLCSVLLMLIIGVLTALVFWTSDGADSPLLPDYLKYQPFDNYWTIFILAGILVPLGYLLKQSRMKSGTKTVYNKA